MNPDFRAPPDGAVAAAVQWIQAVLLGSLASAVSVIAVAAVGFMLLQGRVDLRRAAQVIFGCFILFGASTIAAGIMRAVDGSSAAPEYPASQPVSAPLPSTVSVGRTPAPYDPYAGAALPGRG